MNEFLENLKRQAEEQPMVALGIAAGLITAVSHLINASSKRIDANSNRTNAKAWDRETARRVAKDLKKQK